MVLRRMVVPIKKIYLLGIGIFIIALLLLGGKFIWTLNRPVLSAPLVVRVGANYGLYVYSDTSLEVIEGTILFDESNWEWEKKLRRKKTSLPKEIYSEIISFADKLNEYSDDTGYLITGHWGTDISIRYNGGDYFILYNYPEALNNLKGGDVSDEYVVTVNTVREITDLLIEYSPIPIAIQQYT